MKLEEIYLGENDTKMLIDLVEDYNKDKPNESKKTFQDYAEGILKDAIYFEWRQLKSH